MSNEKCVYHPRDHPSNKGHKFYAIDEQADGTVDVYLSPTVRVYDTNLGIREYDVSVRVVRGVVPWNGLEDDIRARFDAWCEIGEEINM